MNTSEVIAFVYNVFEMMNFTVQKLSFERFVKEPEMRELLSNQYRHSDPSRILRNEPDFFLIHRDANQVDKAGLFAKVLVEGNRLSFEMEQVFREFFPPEIMLLTIIETDGRKQLLARWWNEHPDQNLPLAQFLDYNDIITLKPLVIEQLEQMGVDIQ